MTSLCKKCSPLYLNPCKSLNMIIQFILWFHHCCSSPCSRMYLHETHINENQCYETQMINNTHNIEKSQTANSFMKWLINNTTLNMIIQPKPAYPQSNKMIWQSYVYFVSSTFVGVTFLLGGSVTASGNQRPVQVSTVGL